EGPSGRESDGREGTRLGGTRLELGPDSVPPPLPPRLGIQRFDLVGELLGEDRALDAELGRQVALLLGEVPVEYPELPDRLRAGDGLVGVVHGGLDLGVQARLAAEVRRGPVGGT